MDQIFHHSHPCRVPCLLLVLAFILYPNATWAQHDARHEFSSLHMGTAFHIVLYASSDSLAETAAGAAFTRIENLDSMLSDYEPDSELNRLSRRSKKGKPIPVSASLFQVLKKAQEVSVHTRGAFDITVGPFVRLWRDLKQEPNPKLPEGNKLVNARKKIGYQNIKLNSREHTVRLTKSGMQLDLGGIAKGFAVDEALGILRKHGIRSALVDGGGDIAAGEAPPGEKGWHIEIYTQKKSGNPARISLRLSNKAVATSGDLYQYVKINDRRYSHIIDPRTGVGLTDQSRVSVIAPDGISADSYASAVSVLGPVKGLKLVENMSGVAVYIERNENGHIESWQSERFKKYIAPVKKPFDTEH